ncbi:MAG: hypothetical protein D6685_14920, partial [Bacteroidetes bacterium]
EVRGTVVVNAAGPEVDAVLGGLDAAARRPRFELSTAMNLVTRQVLPTHAVGLRGRFGVSRPDGSQVLREQVLFMAPWRGYSLVGTVHAPYEGPVTDRWVTEPMVQALLDAINQAYPPARLTRRDVYLVHRGFLPQDPARRGDDVSLLRQGQVIDHARDDGVEGLITAIGVKFTTARHLAEQVVDLVVRKGARPASACRTRHEPIPGGHLADWRAFLDEQRADWPVPMPEARIERLVRTYGTNCRALWPYWQMDASAARPVASGTDITRAEVRHAVEHEAVVHLDDVVRRRTAMGSAGPPPEKAVEAAAQVMAAARGWDARRTHQEIDRVWSAYALAEGPEVLS